MMLYQISKWMEFRRKMQELANSQQYLATLDEQMTIRLVGWGGGVSSPTRNIDTEFADMETETEGLD